MIPARLGDDGVGGGGVAEDAAAAAAEGVAVALNDVLLTAALPEHHWILSTLHEG